ncbi:MAG: phytanoyl-CoA dioxygenase family protein [Capsulimonadaceae bacterium]|nr:phytanoyl-CoA dioxygenase family protein [Capsulimonadaceae bacterium]
MTFTSNQLDQFQTEGYLIVPGFFESREVAAMQGEIERFKREGKLRNVATEGDGATHSTTKANLQLCPMSPHSELFKTLPFAPEVRAAISELIGNPVVLHLDQVFLKPARHGAGTNWHQDNAYFQIEQPLMGAAMWIAVHDANLENGTLRVIPGSHLSKLEHTRDPDSDHHIRCYPSEENVVPAIMQAGGVIFFAYGVAHATGANRTEHDRAGAAYHFVNGKAVDAAYFQSRHADTKHPYLTGDRYDGGLLAYGDNLDGEWDGVVERTRALAPR